MSRNLQTTRDQRDSLRDRRNAETTFSQQEVIVQNIKKPKDNLRPEGEFKKARPHPYRPNDRAAIITHPDNFKFVGDFYPPQPKYIEPGQRPEVKKPEINDDGRNI
jgi:hypothetical protein